MTEQIPQPKPTRWPHLIAWGLILLYILTFTWLALQRHYSFNSSGFDLGIYDQVAWNSLHGRPMFYTTTGEPLLHFSNHASPIMLLVAVFYLIHSGPETLLLLQPLAIGLGGLPLFWLSREKLASDFAALSLLAAYLLFPTLQIVNLWDFHPPVLAVGFFMAAFYCIEKHRWGWFFVWAILAMACKEQLPLQVAFLGLYILIRHRQAWRIGLLTIALAMVWFFTVMLWLIPANSVTGDHLFIGYYADLGDSPAEIVLTALTRPDLVLRNLWQPAKLQYLFDVLTPFAYLPILGFPILLIGTPSFAINLLSANAAMHDATGAQYGADVAPWLAWSALYGLLVAKHAGVQLLQLLPHSARGNGDGSQSSADSSSVASQPSPPPLPKGGELDKVPPSGTRALSSPADSSSVARQPPLNPPQRGGDNIYPPVKGGDRKPPHWGDLGGQRGDLGGQTVAPATTLLLLLSAILLTIALVWQLFRGYSPLALDPPQWEITPHDQLAQRFIEQIPPMASLAASGKLYPHVSNRLIAYQLPDVNEAEYVWLDVTVNTWPVHPNDVWALTRDLLDSGEYGVLDGADGYLLLQRGLPDSTLPAEFYDFARVDDSPSPDYATPLEFENGLRLLGFDVLDDPRRQETALRFYWQPTRPLEDGLRLYPFILNEAGQIIETTEQRPLLTQLWYPPQLWQVDEIVIAETMPWPLGERWSIGVGLLRGDNWSDWEQRLRISAVESSVRRFEADTWARLTSFERQGRSLINIELPSEIPPPTHPRQANFGDQLTLLGYDVSPTPTAGRELAVTLHWQAAHRLAIDYTVFVHLVDADGQRVAQHDGQPWWAFPLPTSSWQPDERLRDLHRLPLPNDLPSGEYRLHVGVYDWQTLERLPVLAGGAVVSDFVELGVIVSE